MHNNHTPYKVHSGTPCKVGESIKVKANWESAISASPSLKISVVEIVITALILTCHVSYSTEGPLYVS